MALRMEIRIDVTGKIVKGVAPKLLFQGLRDGFNEGGLFLEQEVAKKTPVNRGFLRSSISHDVRGSGATMFGRVFSPLEYARPVEEGQTPHWPPFRPILQWVTRKKGEAGLRAKKAAFAIMRKIATVGVPAVRMFRKTARARSARAVLARIFQKHMSRFINKLKVR